MPRAVCARQLVCTRDKLGRISAGMGAWNLEAGPSRTGAAGTDHGAELPAASGPGSGQPGGGPGQHATPPSDSSLPLGGTAELEPPTKRARVAEVAPSAPQSSAAAMLGAALLRAEQRATSRGTRCSPVRRTATQSASFAYVRGCAILARESRRRVSTRVTQMSTCVGAGERVRSAEAPRAKKDRAARESAPRAKRGDA